MIRVNPANPVEFLACCGLLELAWLADGERGLGHFEGQSFVLSGPTPAHKLIENLLNAKETHHYVDDEVVSTTLDVNGVPLVLDWYTESVYKLWTGREKFDDLWSKTANRVCVRESALDNWPAVVDKVGSVLYHPAVPRVRPGARSRMQAAKHFNFDPRTAANSCDLGFSPNEEDVKVPVFIYAEILAAVGSQRFRMPTSVDDGKTFFSYRAWEQPLPAPTAAVAQFCASGRSYRCTCRASNRHGRIFTPAMRVNCV